MITTDTDTQMRDFYEYLIATIQIGHIEDASQMIMSLSDLRMQLNVLSKIADEVVRLLISNDSNSKFAVGMPGVPTAYNTFGRGRGGVVPSGKYNNTELALSLAGGLKFAHNLFGSGFVDFDNVLNYSLTNALSDANKIDNNFPLYAEFTTVTSHTSFIKTILISLERIIAERPNSNPLTKFETPEKSKDSFQFTLIGVDILTPQNLANVVAPYLQALCEVQRVVSDIKGIPFSEPQILSLTQNSPITADFSTTLIDAVDVARKLSTAEGRELAREADRAAVMDAQANVALTEAKASETQANELKIRAEAEAAQADAALKYAQAEQLSAEAAKIRFETEKAKIEFWISMLKELGPNLTDVQRTSYLMRLMQPLGVLIESPLRPDNLPEQ